MRPEFIAYLILLLFTVILGLVNFSRITYAFKLLTVLVAITFITESYSVFLARVYHNTSQAYHIYHFFEYALISLMYYTLLRNRYLKRLILISVFIVDSFVVLNAFIIQPFKLMFPSNVALSCEVLYGIFALLLFRQLVLNGETIRLYKLSVFWFNSAVLFFASCMFLNFGLVNYYIKHKFNYQFLLIFSNATNAVFYSIIAYSIFLNSKEKNSSRIIFKNK